MFQDGKTPLDLALCYGKDFKSYDLAKLLKLVPANRYMWIAFCLAQLGVRIRWYSTYGDSILKTFAWLMTGKFILNSLTIKFHWSHSLNLLFRVVKNSEPILHSVWVFKCDLALPRSKPYGDAADACKFAVSRGATSKVT